MSSPNISFNSIPSTIRKPGRYFEFNTSLAVRSLPGNTQRVLILASGIATATDSTVVDVYDDAQAATLFGAGSLAHRMVIKALRSNPYMSLAVVALDDSTWPQSSASIVIADSATAMDIGFARLVVDDADILVDVTAGMTGAAVKAALADAINRRVDLPVTAAVDAATGHNLILKAKTRGRLGDTHKLNGVMGTPGLTMTVPAGFTGGGTKPTVEEVQPLLDAVKAAGHNLLVSPWNDTTSLGALRDHLAFVSGPLEKRNAVGVFGWTGDLAAGLTLTATLNSGRLTGGLIPSCYTWAPEVAADYAAQIAAEDDPARPLNLRPLATVMAPVHTARLSRTQQEAALHGGLTPLEVGPDGRVRIVRAITTYTRNEADADDPSLLDLTTIRTLDYVLYAIDQRIALRFPREKKTQRTKQKVKDEILDVLYKLEELEIIENVDANKDGLLVEDDSQDPNRLDTRIPVDVVNGLHVFAGRIDLIL